jgi:hypothetical protein
MTAQEEAARLDRELTEARRDLRATVEQFTHKVEAVEAQLLPEAIIRRNTPTIFWTAAALGFVAGMRGELPRLEGLAVGALLTAAFTHKRKGNGQQANGDGPDERNDSSE